MSAHYEQTATIPLTGAWTPIGSDRFTGSYDGGGYTIQNMTISANSADANVGLFASIEGTVKNVNLTGVDITNGISQGGVAGTNFGTVQNCSVTGTIKAGAGSSYTGGVVGYNSGTVQDCWSSSIVAGNTNTGGITGQNNGTVQYCYSTGNVTGTGDNTGGITGQNDDTIESCYSTGKVTSTGNNVGGIAGASVSLGTIQNCYSTGDVSGNFYVGGIVGTFSGTSLARCYATGNVTGAQNMVGGIVGSTIAAPISSCVALNPTITSGQPVSIGRVAGNATGTMGNLYGRKDMLVNGTVLTTGIGPNTINGGDVSTATPSYHDQSFWEQTEGFVFGPTTGPWEWNSDTNLPILRAFPTAAQNHTVKPLPGEISGNGVVGDPFIINDAAGLQLIGTLGYPLTANTYYKLGADIDMTGVTWTPIGTGTGANSFNGTFDGAGHTIDNFTGVSGLFGYIGANGTVKNLGMVDVNINNTASGVTGGLTANNSGTIENCFVSGTVSSTVLGADVGGVVGSLLGGTVRNCYSTADVTSDRRAGGIVGNVSSNTAVIEYCYSTGRVTSTSSNNAAGIVGYTGTTTGTGGGTVQRCVALNASVSGGGNSGRVANMTTDMLSRNYGRNPMTLTGGTLTGATATGKDGANVTVAQSGTQTWWSNTGPLFVFDPAGPWVWNDTTNLPILKGFASGTQNPTVKQPLPGGTPEMVRIKAGTSFMMGSPPSEPGSFDNETQHSVTLTQGFYMGIYPVTQAQYQAVMGTNPSNFKTGVTPGEVQGKRPVEQVSWYETLVFCNKLSVIEGLTPAYSISGSTNPDDWGNVPTASDVTWDAVSIVVGSTGYRLPTEAQWEYACRAGTTTAYYTGDTENDALKDAAWYIDNAGDKTHEVGLKTPNTWGLYDMMGNVVEWCWDWYDNNYGSTAGVAQIDPQGAVSGANRVRRGGSWCYYGEYLRSACRGYYDPDDQVSNHGFRLVRPWQN